jgi:hypothetical protein
VRFAFDAREGGEVEGRVQTRKGVASPPRAPWTTFSTQEANISGENAKKHFTRWSKTSLVFGLPLLGFGLFQVIRLVGLFMENGLMFPGVGALVVMAGALGVGGMFLASTPDHFLLDKDAMTASSWFSPMAKLGRKTVQVEGKVGVRLFAFYPPRKKSKSYRVEFLSADGSAEILATLGFYGGVEAVAKEIGDFFGLPVELPPPD